MGEKKVRPITLADDGSPLAHQPAAEEDADDDGEVAENANNDLEDDEDIQNLLRVIEGISEESSCDEGEVVKVEEDEYEQNLIDKCIQLNLQRQQVLASTLQRITSFMERHEELKVIALQKLRDQKQKNHMHLKQRCFSIQRFGTPYFKDKKSFPCPNNEDTLLMRKRQIVNLAICPTPMKWRRWEMKLLDNAVRNNAFELLLSPLEAQLDFLTDKIWDAKKLGKPTKQLEERQKKVMSDMKSQFGEPLLELLSAANEVIDWMKISASIFNGSRTPEECHTMWQTCLKAGIKREPWSVEETENLKTCAKKFKNQNWDAIAENLGGGRTAYQCYIHFQMLYLKDRVAWKSSEDKKLQEVVKMYQQGNHIPFRKIASQFPGRSAEQIRQRWVNSLNPNICFGHFSEKEDEILVTARYVHNMSFNEISKLLPMRVPSQLRSRYRRLQNISPAVNWTIDEDRKLLTLAQEKGQKWTEMTEHFPGRERQQLRRRYDTLLKSTSASTRKAERLIMRKMQVWSQLQDKIVANENVTPDFLTESSRQVIYSAKLKDRLGRKKKNSDVLDAEIEKQFLSTYAQPKGRKKMLYNKEDINALTKAGQIYCETLCVNFDWNSEEQIEKIPEEYKRVALQTLFGNLKDLHEETGWEPAGTDLSYCIPPIASALIGIRTIFIEEQLIVNNSLKNERESSQEEYSGSNISRTISLTNNDPSHNKGSNTTRPTLKDQTQNKISKTEPLTSNGKFENKISQPVTSTSYGQVQIKVTPTSSFQGKNKVSMPVPCTLNGQVHKKMSELVPCTSNDLMQNKVFKSKSSTSKYQVPVPSTSHGQVKNKVSEPSTSSYQPCRNFRHTATSEQDGEISDCQLYPDKMLTNREEHLDPSIAFRLFTQRIHAIFLWPCLMAKTKGPTPSDFHGERFKKREAVIEKPVKEVEKEKVNEKPAKLKLTKLNRKRWLKERWRKYREEKTLESASNEVENNDELPVVKKYGRKRKNPETASLQNDQNAQNVESMPASKKRTRSQL